MKTKHFFYGLLTLAVLFTACKKDEKTTPVTDISVTDITLNYEELMLIPGDTIMLIATVQPDDADNKTITWKSNNPDVATVDNNGFVTAVANGETTITATTQDGNKTVSCTITVDYRSQWVGDWDFTSIYYDKCIAPPPWCDSYEVEYHHIGRIEFGKSDTALIVSHTDKQTLHLGVNAYGELYIYNLHGNGYLMGNFIGETEVSFKYIIAASQMYTIGWIVTGKKQRIN